MLHDALPRAGYINIMKQHGFEPKASDFNTFVTWIEIHCELVDRKEHKKPRMNKPIPQRGNASLASHVTTSGASAQANTMNEDL